MSRHNKDRRKHLRREADYFAKYVRDGKVVDPAPCFFSYIEFGESARLLPLAEMKWVDMLDRKTGKTDRLPVCKELAPMADYFFGEQQRKRREPGMN
jgi:hypothetical protein